MQGLGGLWSLVALLWPEPRHHWLASTNWAGILPALRWKAWISAPPIPLRPPPPNGVWPVYAPLRISWPLPGLAECVASCVPVPIHGTGSI